MPAQERRAFVERSCALHVSERLQEGAGRGDIDALVLAVECYAGGLDVQDYDGTTALHAFAERGHVHAVRLLLDRGADLTIASNCGDTALHGTCRVRRARVTLVSFPLHTRTTATAR